MAILGLGESKQPFAYLDDLINKPNWEELHAEISYGISQSEWSKKFVSSGIHHAWQSQEITPYFLAVQENLSKQEQQYFHRCKTTDEKIKYLNALGPIPHPFWLIFIRDNKRIEGTGILNKAKSEDCEWTDNAKYFPTLCKLIDDMPFEQVGRVLLFMTEANNQILPHYDGSFKDGPGDRPNDDFIWFTTKPNTKQIFVMDGETKERLYTDATKKFIWFNELDFHGSELTNHFSFSVRIDGVFKPGIKDTILTSE